MGRARALRGPLFPAGHRAGPPARERRGLPRLALAPALLVGLVFLGYVAYDFRSYFRNQVLAGFDQTVALIPPGQSVLGFPVLPDRHYTEGHPYLVQHSSPARAAGPCPS